MSAAPELRVMNDSEELTREAAELFVWFGEQAIGTRGRFRVALSGGSTPKALYAALAGPAFSGQLDWRRVEFYFGDERCVPPDHAESNFGMANGALFRPLKMAPERIFRMSGESGDPDEAARRYEKLIRERFEAPAPGWPSFDLILLGLGEDGHTASLFPNTQALDERARLVVPSVAPREPKQRLTLTAPAINEARAVVFLVSGPGKATAVHAVLEDRGQNDRQIPAKLVRPVSGRLIWLVDRAAAAALAVTKQNVVSHEE
ncbi:MAG: 6-phosphogluconolactonase [Nitrospirae bacterium]|nr:6-phosphogluconolactonase [Nitrospirota bacterium]